MNRKVTGKAMPMVTGVLLGSGVSLLLTLVCALAVAWLIDREILEELNVGYGIMLVLALSSVSGAWMAAMLVKRQRLPVTMITGGLYLLWLLGIGILCFGGQLQGVVPTTLLVLGCCLATALVGNRKKGNRISVGHNGRYG